MQYERLSLGFALGGQSGAGAASALELRCDAPLSLRVTLGEGGEALAEMVRRRRRSSCFIQRPSPARRRARRTRWLRL